MDWIDDATIFASMDNNTARKYVIMYEEFAKQKLDTGEISEEEGWDMFFGLLHECDERGLLEDRVRILAHINTSRYNPFASKDATVRFIAQLRARMMGLIQAERN